jgi:hypothetical protein
MSEQPTIGEQLVAINIKLDLLIQQRTDHEARLRVLESARWKLVGIATAGGAVAGIVMPLITKGA